MAIQFNDDCSPTGHATIAADRLDPRQREVCTYYDSHRKYEKEEFKFVIKTVQALAPGVLCAAKYEHTGGPFGGQRADLSWGKLGEPDENGDQKVSPWICRLICFGKNKGGKQFPPGPSFDLPREEHFLSFLRRIAFPIQLYNRASGLPILIRGDGWYERERDGALKKKKNGSLVPQVGIERGTSFSPYFCESDFSSEEQFAEFLKRWLYQDVLREAVAEAQPPNGAA